tara:strand:- start:8362 stop:8637 length:276 start_codon:yes stop_codon:yes gene_type:complete
MSYYNTTNLEKEALKKCRKAVISQEKKILDIFQRLQIPLSPTDLYTHFFNKTPITSIRRALSNLTKDGKLEKTLLMKIGGYGKAEHCWKLK